MKGLFYSDPTSVPEADLRSAAGILLPDPAFPVAPPLERAFLRGGDYAVLRHKGPYSDMRAAYDWLYGEWLVQRSEEHTSELQSLMRISYAVFCLKKKKNITKTTRQTHKHKHINIL